MPRVEFSTQQVVCVRIRGRSRGAGMTRDDGGLAARFSAWAYAEGIHTQVHAGSSGGGHHVGFYSIEDAERIEKWLKSQGAIEVEATWR